MPQAENTGEISFPTIFYETQTEVRSCKTYNFQFRVSSTNNLPIAVIFQVNFDTILSRGNRDSNFRATNLPLARNFIPSTTRHTICIQNSVNAGGKPATLNRTRHRRTKKHFPRNPTF